MWSNTLLVPVQAWFKKWSFWFITLLQISYYNVIMRKIPQMFQGVCVSIQSD